MQNTNVITIESGIPIPEVAWARTTAKYNFMDNLNVTDSFAINGNTPDFTPKGVRQHLYGKHHVKNSNRRYTIRTTSGHHSKPRAIRVWRIS